ncbi:hypothetical protein AgCh_017348 [Apium graveolens]
MKSPRHSPVIQRLSLREIHTSIHPSTIDDSPERVDEEIVFEGPTTTNGDPSSNFTQQWLQHVQHDTEVGPSSVPLLIEDELTVKMGEALQEIREDYLVILGSNDKDLTPVDVYEAINNAAKVQLKSMNYLGKWIKAILSAYL